ncbi:MAG: U-box domain-containing protein [Chlamydiales bacterium]
MSISATSSFSGYSHYFNPLLIQLSDDPQSRYTIVRVSIPERPIPPSPPSVDRFSLPQAAEIGAVPEELHQDALFQAHIDPIFYEPILDPVADKNEPKHIYERANILLWLKDHPTSPLTRKPMTTADLVPVLELKEKINEKIRDFFLQKQPELLAKHQKKIEEANKQYQEALDLYHKVDVPQYERKYRNLSCRTRVSLFAHRCITALGRLLAPQFNEPRGLQGRVAVLSAANSPLTSQIQNALAGIISSIKGIAMRHLLLQGVI